MRIKDIKEVSKNSKKLYHVENAKAAGLRNVGIGTDLLQNASKLGFRSRMLFPKQAEGQVCIEVFLAAFRPIPFTGCHNNGTSTDS